MTIQGIKRDVNYRLPLCSGGLVCAILLWLHNFHHNITAKRTVMFKVTDNARRTPSTAYPVEHDDIPVARCINTVMKTLAQTGLL